MPVPDRSLDVKAICDYHREAFPHTDQNDAARLVLLRGVIIPYLNGTYAEDDNNWGYLTKTDQRQADGSYKVPCDVLAWRPTMVTIDCMTGTGACWIVQGVAPPAWQWTKAPELWITPPTVDESVPVYYADDTSCPMIVGTIVPQPDGFVVLIDAAGAIVSPQPDGRIEMRTRIGGWERATRVGSSLLRYDGTGSTYYVVVEERGR